MVTSTADKIANPVIDGVPLRTKLRRAERVRKMMAFGLTLPLLTFLSVTFIFPILWLLALSVKSPELAEVWPDSTIELQKWDGASLPPPPELIQTLVREIITTYRTKKIGKAAKRVNYHYGGMRSFLKQTGRKLHRAAENEGFDTVINDPHLYERLIGYDKRWGEKKYWSFLRQAAPEYTNFFLLRSLDFDLDENDEIVPVREEIAVNIPVLIRTIWISVITTAVCLLLGYPIAFLLATVPTRQSNILILLLLLPFWTSLLVRTTAWLVLLQNEGVVNDVAIWLGAWEEPIQMVRNRMGTYIGMVHIMLPFMALPLFAVMKRIDPYHMKAAMSLGGTPIRSFFKVYVPQTRPGVGAGVLLVFIISTGFYLTPALIGGPADQMLSFYVVFNANSTANWGMASALSLVLMTVVAIFLVLYHRTIGLSNTTFGSG